jgi:UDP-N-acetylglucosamine 2-epimerase (non-hydrolysing)
MLISEIVKNSNNLPLIFPVHPGTVKVLSKLAIDYPNLFLIDPLGYIEFNYLVERSKAVITDYGGITEETTVMGIPCIALSNKTERPETISFGTNELIGLILSQLNLQWKSYFRVTGKKEVFRTSGMEELRRGL